MATLTDECNHSCREAVVCTRHCGRVRASYHHHLPILDFSDKLGLLAVPLLHLHQLVSLHGKGGLHKQKHISRQMSRQRLTSSSSSHSPPSAHFDVAVIRCGLIKLLSQLGGELSVPEGAQGFHHHLVSILADDDCRFGDVAHLSCGKTNTCTRRCRKLS